MTEKTSRGNGSTLSGRCGVISILTLILTLLEVAFIYRWEVAHHFAAGCKYFGMDNSGGLTEDGFLNEAADFKESLEIRRELQRRLKYASSKKVILIWIPMFGTTNRFEVDRTNCGKCEISYNRSLIDDESVGAVVFHFHAIKKDDMPQRRNPNHLYIFWSLESTATVKILRGHSLEFESNFKFNATMTYRRDSDFYDSYDHSGTVESIVANNKLSLKELLSLKTKFAVAIVSNCGLTNGASKRLRLLKQMLRFDGSLEMFGGCFRKVFTAAGGSKRYRDEIQKYKFYISFENSYHCKDYITEKFFHNALIPLTVPVVWGAKRKDYEAVAPPGSFIFAEDFSSMKELVQYLEYLDKNDYAYMEYFRWLTMKPNDMPQYGRARRWCQICRSLHGINVDDVYNPSFNVSEWKRPLFTDRMIRRTQENLASWFYGEENPECFQAQP